MNLEYYKAPQPVPQSTTSILELLSAEEYACQQDLQARLRGERNPYFD